MFHPTSLTNTLSTHRLLIGSTVYLLHIFGHVPGHRRSKGFQHVPYRLTLIGWHAFGVFEIAFTHWIGRNMVGGWVIDGFVTGTDLGALHLRDWATLTSCSTTTNHSSIMPSDAIEVLRINAARRQSRERPAGRRFVPRSLSRWGNTHWSVALWSVLVISFGDRRDLGFTF